MSDKKQMTKMEGIENLFENYFKQENLIYYRANIDNIIDFKIPYSIGNLDYKVSIQLTCIVNENIARMGFVCKLNRDKDYSKELLDLNADLPRGRLSVELDSSDVRYSHSFIVTEDTNIEDAYRINLNICFFVLQQLYIRNIIEKPDDKNEQ